MSAGSAVTIKLLHEAAGHVVTIEVKGGASYRGKLHEGEQACPVLQGVS
jgi:small nuclear ribonucleoprotein D3